MAGHNYLPFSKLSSVSHPVFVPRRVSAVVSSPPLACSIGVRVLVAQMYLIDNARFHFSKPCLSVKPRRLPLKQGFSRQSRFTVY